MQTPFKEGYDFKLIIPLRSYKI